MRRLLSFALLGWLFILPTGCGGSPEEADTSHLESDEAKAAAEAGRAAYEKAGRKGPPAAKTP